MTRVGATPVLQMAELRFNFLGDLEVLRAGSALALPPSKKTRALLAYLAMTERAFRRELLCELFWEMPDDPRGSLRWSLSKLRRLVDDANRQRIQADRLQVSLDASDVFIDVQALRAAAGKALDASVKELEGAVALYRGNFLEGLDLSTFYDFHSWCIGERERAAQSYAAILRALIDRFADAPERALPHARALVGIAPYDDVARAELIRRLTALHRADEAQHQYQLGKRLMQEVGSDSSDVLYRALHGAPGATRVAAAANQAAAPSTPAPARADDALIGRDAEVQMLQEAYATVVSEQRAAFVLLRGDPGIGKTRLLAAMATLAPEPGAYQLAATAFEAETMRPFALWIDALRSRGSAAVPTVFDGSDHDNRDRLFGALNDLVAGELHNRAVVLLFDDLHWCDESSAAALHYVARMNRRRPLLGVLAAREDELRDNAGVQQALSGMLRDGMLHELKLAPLSPTAVRTLIELRAPGADGAQLSTECAGNPMLAIELARAVTKGEHGSSLDELIRGRLDRADDGGDVLMWAAVLAPRIDVATLIRVTGLDAQRVGSALAAAERQAMLRSSERGYRFSHHLVERLVYAEIPPARRQVMHRRVAELLEHDTAIDLKHASDLAHHALLSGDATLAARATVSAGRLCLRFFANDDAAALARQGLTLARQLPDSERVCITLDLHDIMRTAAPVDDWEGAAREYVALAEQALDHGALAHARLGYHLASYMRWRHGHWSGALEETLQAERVTRGASEEDHIIGMAETAKCLALLERDLPHADAMLMEANALAVRKRLSHPAIPTAMGMLRFQENRLDEAEELFKEARTLCKAAGDRLNEFMANEYLLMVDIERGRFEAARERCCALLDIGDRLGGGSEGPFARALDGLCRYAIEDRAEMFDAALVDLRHADAKHRLAYALTRAALIDVERGRAGAAIAHADEALACAEMLERATDIVLAHVALAQAHRIADNAEGFAHHVAALHAFDGVPVARWARERAVHLTDGCGLPTQTSGVVNLKR